MIRRATIADLDGMTQLLLDHSEILRSHHFGEPNEDTLRMALAVYLTTPSAFAFVAEDDAGSYDGAVVLTGLIVCHMFSKPVTGLLTCIEIHWGTRPDWPSRGIDLKRAAEREAIERGAVTMMISAPNTQDQRVARILERSGYIPMMTVYEKAL
jgi:hypothetical protein